MLVFFLFNSRGKIFVSILVEYFGRIYFVICLLEVFREEFCWEIVNRKILKLLFGFDFWRLLISFLR